jgi:hypothetical protein
VNVTALRVSGLGLHEAPNVSVHLAGPKTR